MARSSQSPNSLLSGDSPSPSSFLMAQRLTPRRLPPIDLEGQRPSAATRAPPPSPVPWSWYHRHCSQAPRPRKLHKKREQNQSKSARSPNATSPVKVVVEVPRKILSEADGSWSWSSASKSTSETRNDTSEPCSSLMDSRPSTPETKVYFAKVRLKDMTYLDADFEIHEKNSGNATITNSALATTTGTVTIAATSTGTISSTSATTISTTSSTGTTTNTGTTTGTRTTTSNYTTPSTETTTSTSTIITSITRTTTSTDVPGTAPTASPGRAKDHQHLHKPHLLREWTSQPSYPAETSKKIARNQSTLLKNIIQIPNVDFGMFLLDVSNNKVYKSEEIQLLETVPKPFNMNLQSRMYPPSLQESQTSKFLLDVAQALFEEMVSLDQLIKKILEVAQRLVSADRASLFLVDYKNFELVSTVFDLRYEPNSDSDISKKEIRMPINKGIAGHVALSGETMNIPDAYLDERFNKEVDEATGYRTVSILCMPIKVRGKVIAVVQMVNKRDKKAFGADDEAAFQVFSTFFGLALHHARLYDKIKRKEQKYKVALEVLGYHNTCAEEDVSNLLEEIQKLENINYNDFALNPFEVNDVQKCKGILTMFDDLFDITKFDTNVLARFVLTVKKNYRKVPYHNFDHGWAVANAMYVILKHDTENKFNYYDKLALFISCLCHDLDHRGYTNKFMNEIASPLAAIYTTSTLEHHHFNMTVTILQQDGHNIFFHMSGAEYKTMLDSIRQCILATDLATFFPNLKKINELVFETSNLDWSDVSHRDLCKSFSMTCADLCAAAKPFPVQLETVDIITEEFYQQGDLERKAGRTPIPMMDRSRPEELPTSQVGFLSQVCLPCYKVLYELFPDTQPMLDMASANLDSWKARASTVQNKNKIKDKE